MPYSACDLSPVALGDPGLEKPSVPEAGKTQPDVCLRLSAGPSAAVHSPLAVQNGFLRMLVHSYTAELFMSFLTNLGPFLEDEIIPEVIPMEIEVVDAKITLKVSVWGSRGSPRMAAWAELTCKLLLGKGCCGPALGLYRGPVFPILFYFTSKKCLRDEQVTQWNC